MTLIICIGMCLSTHTIWVWGLVSFIFSWAFQSLCTDRRRQLHTFFYAETQTKTYTIMKKLFTLATIIVAMVLSSCEFDDSEIWDKLKEHEKRIATLEELCKQMNTNITSLQTLVHAHEKRDYITNVSVIRKDGEEVGYTISFAQSNTITIYHGQDGVNGKDGYTPKIGIKKDTNGVYYWTIDGAWLLDGDGNKVKAVGADGENGQDGANGVTPRLKIENDYWYVSYDEGRTWIEVGKATGEDGSNGIDGDTMFKDIIIEDGYVILILNDGNNSKIKIPFMVETQLSVYLVNSGSLKDKLTIEEQRSVTSLKITGLINNDDLLFVNTYLRSLETLDLSDAVFDAGGLSTVPMINPLNSVAANRTLRNVILGAYMRDGELAGTAIDVSYCPALETLTFTANCTRISKRSLSDTSTSWPKRSRLLLGTPNLSKIVIAEGVTELAIDTDAYGAIYCVCRTIELPSTLKMICDKIFGLYWRSTVICRATTPPSIYSGPGSYTDGWWYEPRPATTFYDAYKQMKDMTLYVPAESVDLYRTTSGWSQFGTILPIE